MNELLTILQDIRPDVDFEQEKRLISDGIWDSLDIVGLMDEINDCFGVDIKPSHLNAENFNSAEAIYKLIESLK